MGILLWLGLVVICYTVYETTGSMYTSDMVFLIVLAILTAIIVLIIDARRHKNEHPGLFEPEDWCSGPSELEYLQAGRRGERAAADAIRSVLREGDFLLTNVQISFDGRPAELDNVIVNTRGVFIIEVKNYKGLLQGNEEDYEWDKYKDDGYGNTFQKRVKNPIKQVKRQIFLLAQHLKYYGFNVWVEGYALLIQGNSPVKSPFVLEIPADIDRVIHTANRNHLTKHEVEEIVKLLDETGAAGARV